MYWIEFSLNSHGLLIPWGRRSISERGGAASLRSSSSIKTGIFYSGYVDWLRDLSWINCVFSCSNVPGLPSVFLSNKKKCFFFRVLLWLSILIVCCVSMLMFSLIADFEFQVIVMRFGLWYWLMIEMGSFSFVLQVEFS